MPKKRLFSLNQIKSALNHSFIRFAIVGGMAALTHLTVVAIFVEILKWEAPIANVPAFLIAFMVSLLGQRWFTFQATSSLMKMGPRWFAVSLTAFALNQTLFVTLIHTFPNVHYLVLLFIVTLLVAVFSYILGKYWAFSSSGKPHS